MRSSNQRIESVPNINTNGSIYEKKLDGILTASFVHTSKKTPHKKSDDGQSWLFEVESLSELNGIIELNSLEANDLNFAASQLMDIIALDLTKKIPYGISDGKLEPFLDYDLDVENYMKYRGLADKNQAVKQLKKDLNTLFNSSIKATIKRHKTENGTDKIVTEHQEVRIIDEQPDGQIRNYAHIHIASAFARYLIHYSQIMAYPIPLLLSVKNHNVYYIGRKLAEYYNINRTKKQKNCISIKELLKATPEIPTLEEEREKGRHYRDKCIIPLEKTLDALKKTGIIEKWHFVNKNRTEIPQTDLLKYDTSFEEWLRRYVWFELKNYPSYEKNKDE